MGNSTAHPKVDILDKRDTFSSKSERKCFVAQILNSKMRGRGISAFRHAITFPSAFNAFWYLKIDL